MTSLYLDAHAPVKRNPGEVHRAQSPSDRIWDHATYLDISNHHARDASMQVAPCTCRRVVAVLDPRRRA